MYKENNRFEFYTPQGSLIPTAIQTKRPNFTVQDIATLSDKNVSAETLIPAWAGEKMDLGMAVEGLLSSRRH